MTWVFRLTKLQGWILASRHAQKCRPSTKFPVVSLGQLEFLRDPKFFQIKAFTSKSYVRILIHFYSPLGTLHSLYFSYSSTGTVSTAHNSDLDSLLLSFYLLIIFYSFKSHLLLMMSRFVSRLSTNIFNISPSFYLAIPQAS